MNLLLLQPADSVYPAPLQHSNKSPSALQTIGNQELLQGRKTAVFCSHACPGEVILRVYDLARLLRDADLTFIGGFHTPVERDLLHHLLAGSCKLVLCPARSLEGMRVPAAWQRAVMDGRLLLLSPFAAPAQRRQSARLAALRNELVAALADQILLLHAAPGSHTERLLQSVATAGKRVLTLELDDDALLRRLTENRSGPPLMPQKDMT